MPNRLFLRLYAATYDLFNKPAERAGLRQQRHELLAQATGATIEIGAGTGLNLPHYPPAVTRLVLIEPDPYMRRRLLFFEHVRSADPRIAAKQDKIPFPYPLIGCRPNRDTLREIEASPLAVESVRDGELPKAPEIERPMIVGTARRLLTSEPGQA